MVVWVGYPSFFNLLWGLQKVPRLGVFYLIFHVIIFEYAACTPKNGLKIWGTLREA